MSGRNLALIAAAALVLGLGVYLFLEVRAAPASPSVPIIDKPRPREVTPVTIADPPKPPEQPAVTPERPPIHLGTADVPAPSIQPTTEERANPKLDSLMDEANKAYDRQDFDEAKAIAGKLLSKQPTNVRMLRVMVSSSCVDGDKDTAQKYFEQLPKFDREQMKQRCERYGIAFKDPAQ